MAPSLPPLICWPKLGDVPLGSPWDLLVDGSEAPQSARGRASTLETRLLSALRWQDLSGPVPPAYFSDPSGFLRRFRHRQPTVLFAYASLDAARRQDLALYIRAFCDFWSGWGDQNQLMLVCLFIGYPQCSGKLVDRVFHRFLGGSRRVAEFERGLDRIRTDWASGVGGAVLPTLRPVRQEEVQQWATRLKDSGFPLDGHVQLRLLKRIDDLCKGSRPPPGERAFGPSGTNFS